MRRCTTLSFCVWYSRDVLVRCSLRLQLNDKRQNIVSLLTSSIRFDTFETGLTSSATIARTETTMTQAIIRVALVWQVLLVSSGGHSSVPHRSYSDIQLGKTYHNGTLTLRQCRVLHCRCTSAYTRGAKDETTCLTQMSISFVLWFLEHSCIISLLNLFCCCLLIVFTYPCASLSWSLRYESSPLQRVSLQL